jgi:hypothetical protein
MKRWTTQPGDIHADWGGDIDREIEKGYGHVRPHSNSCYRPLGPEAIMLVSMPVISTLDVVQISGAGYTSCGGACATPGKKWG